MKIELTNYGKLITIQRPDGKTFEYPIYNVHTLNDWHTRVHPCIEELAQREAKLEHKLIMLLRSMEYSLRELTNHDAWERWELHNRLDWTDYYPLQARDLCDAIDDISFEYAHRARADGYGCTL